MFVIVSWVSFLVKPEVVPGRSVYELFLQINFKFLELLRYFLDFVIVQGRLNAMLQCF